METNTLFAVAFLATLPLAPVQDFDGATPRCFLANAEVVCDVRIASRFELWFQSDSAELYSHPLWLHQVRRYARELPKLKFEILIGKPGGLAGLLARGWAPAPAKAEAELWAAREKRATAILLSLGIAKERIKLATEDPDDIAGAGTKDFIIPVGDRTIRDSSDPMPEPEVVDFNLIFGQRNSDLEYEPRWKSALAQRLQDSPKTMFLIRPSAWDGELNPDEKKTVPDKWRAQNALAAKRGLAAKQWLVRAGVPESQIQVGDTQRWSGTLPNPEAGRKAYIVPLAGSRVRE